MEHPLISNLSELTEDEIINRISDLNKKLVIAARTGNGYLANQVRMALESYQNQYRAIQEQKTAGNSNSHLDKIDIS